MRNDAHRHRVGPSGIAAQCTAPRHLTTEYDAPALIGGPGTGARSPARVSARATMGEGTAGARAGHPHRTSAASAVDRHNSLENDARGQGGAKRASPAFPASGFYPGAGKADHGRKSPLSRPDARG